MLENTDGEIDIQRPPAGRNIPASSIGILYRRSTRLQLSGADTSITLAPLEGVPRSDAVRADVVLTSIQTDVITFFSAGAGEVRVSTAGRRDASLCSGREVRFSVYVTCC